jgi:ankyrin repeat protein
VAILIRYRADPNATAGADWTPLHIAAQRGDLEICKMLVTAGAKVDAKTFPLPGGVQPGSPDGKPIVAPAIPALIPLDLARDGKHTAVIEYLANLKR